MTVGSARASLTLKSGFGSRMVSAYKALAAPAACVGDFDEVTAIGRRGEGEARVAATCGRRCRRWRSWAQTVRHDLAADGPWLDNVAGFIERVGDGAGVEVGAAFATVDVEEAAAIRPAWHAHDLHHVAIEIDELVQLHLLPVLQADVRVVGINAAEVVVAVAHGLEHHTRHGLAFRVEDVELCVGR